MPTLMVDLLAEIFMLAPRCQLIEAIRHRMCGVSLFCLLFGVAHLVVSVDLNADKRCNGCLRGTLPSSRVAGYLCRDVTSMVG
jgi:hypothetical protein